jgi:hypothetical protein
MAHDTPQIGERSAPRFEFRSFGQDFDRVHLRLSRFSVPIAERLWERTSEEIYVVSRTNDVHNTKIRNGKMDIKSWIATVDGLEQWDAHLQDEFPLAADVMRRVVFPAFQVAMPVLPEAACSYEEFLTLVTAHPDLAAVRVHKHRYGYMVHDTICEYAVVLINGARVVTVSTESTDRERMVRTIADTGMSGLENINYLQAIKRVIGMSPKSLAS